MRYDTVKLVFNILVEIEKKNTSPELRQSYRD